MNNYDGSLLSIEGIDGAGKSTVVDYIEDEMDDTVVTREPSPLWTGKQVYEAISNRSETPPETDFYLYLADRTFHIQEVIKPALEEGKTVICDRYTDSTRAYQLEALKDSLDIKGEVELLDFIDGNIETSSIEPDITIYIDVKPETGMERCVGKDKFENREMLESVRDNYWMLWSEYERIKLVDGEQDKEDVFEDVVELLE